MKVKDLLKSLNRMVKENPTYKDLDVIFASDDEGNSYHRVHNTPTPMKVEDIKQYYLEVVGQKGDVPDEDINAICIN